MEEYKKFWRNYTNFSGRSTLRDYWMVILFNFLLGIITGALNLDYLAYLYSIACLIPGIAIMIRRLHDTNRSGWYWCWGLLPIVGWIILLIALCQKSVDENNKYGPIAN